MGFFDAVGSAASGGLLGDQGLLKGGNGSGVGGPLWNPGNQLIVGNTPQDPSSLEAPLGASLQQMQAQQSQNALDYQKNLPALEGQQQSAATDASRQQLAGQLAGVTRNSNSRGLLYGGYNQGQQADATAQNQANLQTTKANINSTDQNNLSNLQNQAVSGGLAMQQAQNAQALAAYQAALQQQQAVNGEFGSLMSAGGKFAALLAAAA